MCLLVQKKKQTLMVTIMLCYVTIKINGDNLKNHIADRKSVV